MEKPGKFLVPLLLKAQTVLKSGPSRLPTHGAVYMVCNCSKLGHSTPPACTDNSDSFGTRRLANPDENMWFAGWRTSQHAPPSGPPHPPPGQSD